MKLHILSDVHLEFGRWPKAVNINAIEADVTILAGDIDIGLKGLVFALKIKRPVIYVMGNHEFYGQRPMRELWRKARAKVAGTHVHLLENDAVVIDGVRFLGATLWTDYTLHGASQQAERMRHAERTLSDFHAIFSTRRGALVFNEARLCYQHVGDRLTAQKVAAMHVTSRDWLKSMLAARGPEPTVVVTHHAPSFRSLESPQDGDWLDAAYATPLDDLVAQADLWVHGHIHHAVDYRIGKGRVVANPRGYVGGGEVAAWRADYVYELPN